MPGNRIDLMQAELIAEIISKEYPDMRDYYQEIDKIMAAKCEALNMFPMLVKELKECRER